MLRLHIWFYLSKPINMVNRTSPVWVLDLQSRNRKLTLVVDSTIYMQSSDRSDINLTMMLNASQ
jgi:hypothetical protein